LPGVYVLAGMLPVEAGAPKEMQRSVYTETGEPIPNCYYLFGSDARGWRVIRRVRLDQGRRQCMRGTWREVYSDSTCELIGFQLLSTEALKGDESIPSMRSTASIREHEIEANAGLCGCSYTSRLAEDLRLERKRPEDFIERTEAKVRVWPNVGAERGDILRAWPRRGD